MIPFTVTVHIQVQADDAASAKLVIESGDRSLYERFDIAEAVPTAADVVAAQKVEDQAFLANETASRAATEAKNISGTFAEREAAATANEGSPEGV